MVDPPSLQIAFALLRNVRTLFGRTSNVGQKGAPRPGTVNEEISAQAAERDIEVTSNVATSAAEVPGLCRFVCVSDVVSGHSYAE